MQVALSAFALYAFGAGSMAHCDGDFRQKLWEAKAAIRSQAAGFEGASVRAHFLTSPKAPDDLWTLKMGCVQGPRRNWSGFFIGEPGACIGGVMSLMFLFEPTMPISAEGGF